MLSLAPYNDDNRDRGRCVADCFDQVLAYTSPAYTSLDAPRAVTLTYSAATVIPEATVVVDAIDGSGTVPTTMSLKLQRPDGAFEPLLGVPSTPTPTEAFFQGANGMSRLGARFNTGTLATGAYAYSAVVTSTWSDATLTASIPARVLVVRETQSPYGAGWTVAGLERIIAQSDGAVLTSGAGATAFFAGCTTAGSTCTSPKGDFTTLTRRADGTGWDRRWPDGTTAAFDAAGRLTALSDRESNRVSYTYNAAGALTSITDPIGKVTALGYDAVGKLDYITDPTGRVTQVTVTPAGDLTEIWDPDGVRALQIGYDAAHLALFAIDRVGGRSDFTRDFAGKLAQVQLATITASGVSTRPTLALRSIEGQVLADGSGAGTAANPLPRRDPAALRAKITAANGDSTVYAFDRFGQPTRVEFRNPQGQWRTDTTTYNAQGQVTTVTTAEKGSTTYTWSGPDLAGVTNNNTGSSTALGYESTYHQVKTVTVDGNLVQQNFYGTLGRLDSTKVGTSKTAYTYDTRGRALTVTDPLGHQASASYDATGMQNTHSVTTPDANGVSRTTTYAYDAVGRVQSMTDPTGRVFTTNYDPINRVTSATGPLATTTSFGYNDATRTYTVTDPKSQVYQDTRNALGWVETRTDPRGGVERFAYDISGNVQSYTNRRGGVVSTSYDALSQPLTVTADGQTTTFAYDPVNYWFAVSNGESTDTVKLDAKRRLSQAITYRGGVRYLLQPSYTAEGQRRLLEVVAPSWTRDIQYGYDALFRLNYLRNQGGRADSIAYTAEHLPSTVTLPITVSGTTKLTEAFSYNPAHLPTALNYNSGIGSSVGRRYSYDALGRAATITRGIPPGNPNAGEFQDEVQRTLGYDALGRLSHYDDVHNWQQDNGIVCPDPFDLTTCYRDVIPHSDLLRQQDFAYDSVGNRRDLGAVIENGNRVTAFNGYTLAYDADGNLVTKTTAGITQTLSWNTRGQLVSTVRHDTTTSFGYDGFGRRVRKTVTRPASPGVEQILSDIRYLWDGDDLVMELDAAGNPLREYSYFPRIDRPFAMRRSSDGALFYYSQELPGHVAGLISAADQVVNSYENDPWGQPINTTEQVPQPLRYGGREYDTETGFYYLRARYYDPQLGRFISEDPIGLDGGINPFAYVGDNPVNASDPFGLAGCASGYDIVIEIDLDAGTMTFICESPNGGGSYVLGSVGAVTLPPLTVNADPPANPFVELDELQKRGDEFAKSAMQYSLSLQSQGVRWQKGEGPGFTDCSHFVCRVLNVPYQTSHQITNSLCFAPVSSSEARAGDVMYSPQGHVGIYVGRTDSQGRWEGIDWGQRMPNGRTISKWGPGGWYRGPISFYRPLC